MRQNVAGVRSSLHWQKAWHLAPQYRTTRHPLLQSGFSNGALSQLFTSCRTAGCGTAAAALPAVSATTHVVAAAGRSAAPANVAAASTLLLSQDVQSPGTTVPGSGSSARGPTASGPNRVSCHGHSARGSAVNARGSQHQLSAVWGRVAHDRLCAVPHGR